MSLRKLLKRARKPAKTVARGVAIALPPALMAGAVMAGTTLSCAWYQRRRRNGEDEHGEREPGAE